MKILNHVKGLAYLFILLLTLFFCIKIIDDPFYISFVMVLIGIPSASLFGNYLGILFADIYLKKEEQC